MLTEAEQQLIERDIEGFLAQNEQKELCRFVSVGSVDDGKSTLIGRLLHDSKGVYDDQLKDASRTSDTGETAIDFARITDGLRAEREQGITIDVAYRYFSTPKRKFIIADTPGHVQYTRNMATGASTADVALLLIDARLGVLTQSRRHATIASLLGIPHLLVGVNKMDLRDWSEDVYKDIVAHFRSFADALGFQTLQFVPMSALMGVNIVDRGEVRMPWYQGPTVLEFLEAVPLGRDRSVEKMRLPVQTVIRPNLNYRGFAGQLVSGLLRKGDEVVVLPSGVRSRVAGIDTYDGELEVAYPPLGVVVRLTDEVDCSRGDVLAHPHSQPHVGQHLDVDVVWMGETPLDAERSYLIKHGARYVRVNVESVAWRMDLDTLQRVPATRLALNDIGLVRLVTHRPIVFDGYRDNRATGALILIDSVTNTTVGAGMIRTPEGAAAAPVDVGAGSQVSPTERARKLGHRARLTWLTTAAGGADTTALAFALERRLADLGQLSAVIAPSDPRYPDPVDPVGLAARLLDAGLHVLFTGEAPVTPALDRLGPSRVTVIDVGALPVDDLEAQVEATLERLRPLES